MLRLYIGSAYEPKEVYAAETDTIKKVYKDNNVSLAPNAMVTMNSRRLGDAELEKTLSQLGVEQDAVITVTEKYSSSRK